MNKTILSGRLTRDPELKTTTSGTTLCKFGIANNERYGGKDKTHFFDCTAFGKTAEFISKHFLKGNAILIEGKLNFEQWEKDGVKRSKVDVICLNVEFFGAKESATDTGNTAQAETDKSDDVDDGDLPF